MTRWIMGLGTRKDSRLATRITWVFYPLLFVNSCASTSEHARTLEFSSDVQVVDQDGGVKPVPKGTAYPFRGDAATITRPGKLPVVLISVPPDGGNLKLNLPDAEPPKSFGSVARTYKDVDLNAVTSSLVEVQQMLLNRQTDEALARIQSIRESYPGLTYIKFLEASCYLLKGDNPKALALTESGLQDFPNDVNGKSLKAKLTQGSAREAQDE